MITVLGDVIVDQYWNCDQASSKAEFGHTKLLINHRVFCLGGAGAVAMMLAAAGEEVTLAGIVGDDEEGLWVHRECKKLGINDEVYCDRHRVTTVKTRVLIDNKEMLSYRFDREMCCDAPPEVVRGLGSVTLGADDNTRDVLVIQDYGKGVCIPPILKMVIENARQKKMPVVVDPGMGCDWRKYNGAQHIKCNQPEAEYLTGRKFCSDFDHIVAVHPDVTEEEANLCGPAQAAKVLRDRYKVATSITCTWGIATMPRRGRCVVTESCPRAVVDVTGAGDTVAAAIALAYARLGNSDDVYEQMNMVAMHAAAEQLCSIGIRPVSVLAVAWDPEGTRDCDTKEIADTGSAVVPGSEDKGEE